MSNTNPLLNYIRKPEIYIKLPSEFKWWPEGSITVPESGEIAVMAMTGNDDIMLRNADGLINGSSTVAVIESCCPSIKNAWEMPMCDVDFLFMSIRIASSGDEMDIETKCPKCGEISPYSFKISTLLDQYQIGKYDVPVTLENGLIVMFKPAPFKIANKLAQEVFEQQRIILAANSEALTLEQKQKIAQDSITILGNLTLDKMVEYIDFIQIPTGEKVIEKTQIREFIQQADRKSFRLIEKEVESRAGFKSLPDLSFKCDKCGHEYQNALEFDPANFFGADS